MRLLPALFLCLPALAGAAEHRVVIDAMRFSPQVVQVKPGDTIVWENRDMFVHNVTAAATGASSGDLAPGKSWRYVVRGGTSFDYLCTLHPVMKGRVDVAGPRRRRAPAH
ncbi:cupredoxin domain-containing protein [Massilia rhizosphaerae]|uniref:cupredoxin domain-containing protein n=1 Tax=Massilia rhizosphaerae TaxID=2784389 RepID=UPI0018DBECE0|nr:cupredoxin family copper-binding protein [Massilia rhizosphaerae]